MYYITERKPDGTAPGGKVKSVVSQILGVPTQGFHVVAVPPPVKIDEDLRLNPSDGFTAQDVESQKYEGILKANPLFSHIHIIEVFDTTHPHMRGATGNGTHWLKPHDGLLQTAVTSVIPVTNRVAIYLDVHYIVREGAGMNVYYEPADPNDVDVFISCTGMEVDMEQVPSVMTPFEVTTPGNHIIIRLENQTPRRIYIGGLAFLY